MLVERRVCACGKLFETYVGSMRKLCRVCIKSRSIEGVKTYRTAQRSARYLRTYNISVPEYRRLLAQQNGRCAICHKPPPAGKRLHVDHDHNALRVRGLLCTGCNTKLGWLEAHSAAIRVYLRGR